MNKVCIIGNLGSDARIAKVGDKDVANFSVAVNEKKKDEEKTTWFRCALWGGLVPKIGQYLTQGKMVYIEGPVEIEEWTTKDGEVKRDLKIAFVNEIKLLGGGAENRGAASQSNQESKPNPTEKNPFA